MKILNSFGTAIDLTPKEWIRFHSPQAENDPSFERLLDESLVVDQKLLSRAKAAATGLCRKEDLKFCALCLIVLAGPKEPARDWRLAGWINRMKLDLNRLRQIERRHKESIPKMMMAADLRLIPDFNIGPLTQYIHALERLVDALKSIGRRGDIRDDAILLLVLRLRKRNGRLPKRMWDNIANAIDEVGRTVGGEQLRIRFERKMDRDYPPAWKVACRLQHRKKDDPQIKRLRDYLKAAHLR